MIQLAASDLYHKDTNDLGRKAKWLSLLTAVNLAFKGSGAKGCTVTHVAVEDSVDGQNVIFSIAAVPGEVPATLDDVRQLLKQGKM